MTGKKSDHNAAPENDDDAAFRQAMAGVRPLKQEARITPVKKKPRPVVNHGKKKNLSEENPGIFTFSDPADLHDVHSDENLFFARAGIQQKVAKRLRRGEYPPEEELDLHGYTVNEARTALAEFIADCKKQHIRHARIIHGKGFRSEDRIPVIKTHVAYWLPQHPDVLAFASCLAKDGGSGALYLLLKSANKS